MKDERYRVYQEMLAEVNREIESLQRMAEFIKTKLGSYQPGLFFPTEEGRQSVINKQTIKKLGSALMKAEVKILKEVGHSLKTADFYNELNKRGIVIKGRSPKNTLYTNLTRNPAVVKVEPGTWDLRERTETRVGE